MDDQNITMEEYIRLEEEKARRQGRTFDWQTATYGRMEYFEDEDDSFTNLDTEYPAIVFDDTSDAALLWEPTVSLLDNNEIDFKISFDEFDDEDYMVVFDENLFSCKIISVDNLKTNSENENDKVNMTPYLSPEPTFGYIDDLDFFKDFENEFPAIVYNDLKSKSNPLKEPSVSSQHIDKFETSLSEYDEKEQNVLHFNDSFPLDRKQEERFTRFTTSTTECLELHRKYKVDQSKEDDELWKLQSWIFYEKSIEMMDSKIEQQIDIEIGEPLDCACAKRLKSVMSKQATGKWEIKSVIWLCSSLTKSALQCQLQLDLVYVADQRSEALKKIKLYELST
ncbi:hypothetical protein Tco_0677773 [Tanacetum coccineum]|uniref:Uncharacterized protein n=1 Tax=Tanacetum coccineum TaxID=301880 RepID=A0ABQ4XDA3_9ASTR